MYKLESYSELPSIQGIYFITNTVNQKYYLGRAINIKDRYSWKDIEYSHHNYLLRNSILKYGRENFIISIVEYPNISLEELINIEQSLLDTHYGNGLCVNLSPFASGGGGSTGRCGIDSPVYGKIWINNGINEKYIDPKDKIPEGFKIGRFISGENNPSNGKKWYNNGINKRMFFPDEEIPEGFILGNLMTGEKNPMYNKTGEQNPAYGKIWYNNGIEQKYFTLDDEIPDGFIKGSLLSGERNPMYGQKSPVNGKRLYNNGITQRFFYPDEEIPEDYIKGGLHTSKPKANTKKIIINNGITEKYILPNEEIPEGFIKGGLPRSAETKQRISESRKGKRGSVYGKIWYNNGLEQKYFYPEDEIPEGFVPGRLKETMLKSSKAKTGQTYPEAARYKHKINKGTHVITNNCCYYSRNDALLELAIPVSEFKKLFEKDPITGFYVEKNISL